MQLKTDKRVELYFTHDEIFLDKTEYIQILPLTDYLIYMHQQDFYEINIITKGNGIHYIENNRLEVSVGDVFILAPNVVHGYDGGKGFDVFHILISDKFMRKYISDLQQLPNFYTLFAAEPMMREYTLYPLHLTANQDQFKEINKILAELLTYKDKNDSASSISKNSLCLLLICKLCEMYSLNLKEKQDSLASSDESFMKSISFIHENISKKISIEDLCEIAHLSRSSYFRKFKQLCNMPPSLYINKAKIESAKNMLTNTPNSISQIAEQTGFYDLSHFTKIFKLEVGVSPASYRKKYQLDNKI